MAKSDTIPTETLYELYWGKHLTFDEMEDVLDVSRSTVRRLFENRGIPSAPQHNHELFILFHRKRSYLYELYWGKDQTFKEIADDLPFSFNVIYKVYEQRNIAVDTAGNQDRWYDKQRGIPSKYKLPSDEKTVQYQDEALPDNPDGSKYMAETPLHRDKDQLYQLYWGYGLTASQIKARCEHQVNVKQHMRELGIPVRDFNEDKRWKPYLGVPPKFEWPKEDEDEIDTVYTVQKPAVRD